MYCILRQPNYLLLIKIHQMLMLYRQIKRVLREPEVFVLYLESNSLYVYNVFYTEAALCDHNLDKTKQELLIKPRQQRGKKDSMDLYI